MMFNIQEATQHRQKLELEIAAQDGPTAVVNATMMRMIDHISGHASSLCGGSVDKALSKQAVQHTIKVARSAIAAMGGMEKLVMGSGTLSAAVAATEIAIEDDSTAWERMVLFQKSERVALANGEDERNSTFELSTASDHADDQEFCIMSAGVNGKDTFAKADMSFFVREAFKCVSLRSDYYLGRADMFREHLRALNDPATLASTTSNVAHANAYGLILTSFKAVLETLNTLLEKVEIKFRVQIGDRVQFVDKRRPSPIAMLATAVATETAETTALATFITPSSLIPPAAAAALRGQMATLVGDTIRFDYGGDGDTILAKVLMIQGEQMKVTLTTNSGQKTTQNLGYPAPTAQLSYDWWPVVVGAAAPDSAVEQFYHIGDVQRIDHVARVMTVGYDVEDEYFEVELGYPSPTYKNPNAWTKIEEEKQPTYKCDWCSFKACFLAVDAHEKYSCLCRRRALEPPPTPIEAKYRSQKCLRAPVVVAPVGPGQELMILRTMRLVGSRIDALFYNAGVFAYYSETFEEFVQVMQGKGVAEDCNRLYDALEKRHKHPLVQVSSCVAYMVWYTFISPIRKVVELPGQSQGSILWLYTAIKRALEAFSRGRWPIGIAHDDEVKGIEPATRQVPLQQFLCGGGVKEGRVQSSWHGWPTPINTGLNSNINASLRRRHTNLVTQVTLRPLVANEDQTLTSTAGYLAIATRAAPVPNNSKKKQKEKKKAKTKDEEQALFHWCRLHVASIDGGEDAAFVMLVHMGRNALRQHQEMSGELDNLSKTDFKDTQNASNSIGERPFATIKHYTLSNPAAAMRTVRATTNP
jgi:hypothetical protein